MRIAFNPSTVEALITPPNNKDITFDLRGRNIFARGVKFCGTDTNTWRDIKINNVSIGSNILDLRDSSTTTLTNINGVVTINSTWRPVVDNLTSDSTTSSLSANQGRVLKALIDGKSDSDHNHDDRYLRLTGGQMLGDITFGGDNKIIWGRNTDSASISFKNDGDGDDDSYMSFVTSDNGNEYFRWSHSSGSTNTEWMSLRSDGLRVGGTKVSLEGHTHDDRYVKRSGDTMLGALNFANGTWNLVGDDSYMGDCNISGHFGIKAVNTTYPGIAFFNNANDHLGNLTAYNGNIKYGAYSLQFLDNGNTSVSASTWINPFNDYNSNAVADGQAVCVWGQSSYLSNLAADSGDMSLWLKRVNANVATLNMVLDGEYYANGNQRLAHVSEIPNSLKNPYALTISLNGTSQGPYDGSAAKNINITPSSIGAATSDHNHDGRYVRYYAVTTLDCNNLAIGLTAAGVSATNAAHTNHSAFLYISDVGTPFQIQIPDSSVPYIYKRYYSSGTWSEWFKLNAGNADMVDGYHIADESRQVYRNSYTVDNPAGAWILIKLPAWNANNEIVAIDGYGDNRLAHCVVHCGSRYQGIWGYQSEYNGIVVDRIRWKEVDSGKFAIIALINGGITTLTIKATNSLEISKTTEDNAAFAINSNFFSSGGVFHGNVDWDKIIGKPSSFTPSEHTHSWTSITDKIVAGNEFNIVNAGFNSDMYFNYLPINDRNSTAYINSYIFGNGHRGLALVQASGFIKNGSSSNYVLLGDGGHKAISDFAPSSHSHNYAANENYGGFTKSGRLPISGFYQSEESESGGNAPWSSWMHLINCQHSNTGNNYALQIAASFYDNNTFKIRVTDNDVNNDWRDIIHSGNIGSQTVANAYHLYINSANTWSNWYWVGQSGQPSWLWGSNDGTNMYVWDPNNFNVHTAQYLRSLGNQNCQTGRTQNYGDVYSYNTYYGNTGSPTDYTSVIGFGRGIAGTVEIAGGWCNTHLYWRSLRNCCDDWYSWRTVLDSSNYTEFINNYYWANVKISASSSTTTSPTVHTLTATRVCAGHNPEIDNSISCSNWFRSSGDTGWYNTTYRGGWYMSDTSWIRTHNGVGIYTSGQIYSPSSVKAGDILLGHGNEINSDTGLYLNYRSSNNVGLCQGGGNVGIGTTSPSYKLDVNGQMRASGFHHSSVNSDNYILLAGGGYKPYGGNYDNPIFLGYLNLEHGNDGTISSSFYCLGYSVPFTYTRGGNYCKISIPDTSYQTFYIRAAIASVNYSGGGMDTWVGEHRAEGAWWLHCYAYNSNEVRVKGFHQRNHNNDSWWGGNPLWSGIGGANRITVCIFGYVTFR